MPDGFDVTIHQDVAFAVPLGQPGTPGAAGGVGPAGTITVGTVTTGAPGTEAEVENVGTATAAVLNFTIPQGEPGEDAEGGGAVASVNGESGVVVLDQDDIADGVTAKQYTATEQTKLAGVAAGATANASDADLRDRSTHTGTQLASTISDFDTAVDARVVAGITGKLDTSTAPELIRDTMQTALVAGANVTITPNDAGDTITIDATGGGGGSLPAGGIPGQWLRKESSADGDGGWQTLGGPTALGYAALPLPGSTGAGNLTAGAYAREIVDNTIYNAFPAITICPNGDLIAIWRRATSYSAIGVIAISRSSDFGATWSGQATLFSDALDLRDPGLLTLADGRVVAQYRTHGATLADQEIRLSYSDDNGVTWGTPIPVPFAFTQSCYSASAPTELDDGTLLVCAYGKDAGDTHTSVRVVATSDDGGSWSADVTVADGEVDGKPYNEAHIAPLPDGTLVALVRCDEVGAQAIYRSTSTDDGATWSAPALVLSGSGGRPSWQLLASGGMVATYRRISDGAGVFATSWDDGVTWSSPTVIEDVAPGLMAYAQPLEVSPGLVGVVFSDTWSTSSAKVRFKYLADGKGTTPLGDMIGLTAAATVAEIFLPAQGFTPSSGNPVNGIVAGAPSATGYLHDANTNEIVATSQPAMPADWNTFDASLLWCPSGTGAGNVVWNLLASDIVSGSILSTNAWSSPVAVSAAPGVASQVVSVAIASGVPARHAPFSLRVARVAANAGDTYTTDVLFLAVVLTKAS